MRFLLGFVLVMMCATHADADACHRYSFDGDRFTVCELDSHASDFHLYWTDDKGKALRGFDALGKLLGTGAKNVEFAMNAGMFETNGMPLGLYVEHGIERRPLNTRNGSGNFYMKPNGVFEMNAHGKMKIETSEAFASDPSPPEWATQSGPMLVIDGSLAPQIAADGPSKNIRNGVGLRDVHTAFFAISDDPVSFGKLARFLRDGMGCKDALYFDGAVSSLWAPSLHREDTAAPLGPMLVVTSR